MKGFYSLVIMLLLSGCHSVSTPYSAWKSQADYYDKPLGMISADEVIPSKGEVAFARRNKDQVAILSCWAEQAKHELFIYARSEDGALRPLRRDEDSNVKVLPRDTEILVFTRRGEEEDREEALLNGLVSRDIFKL